MIDQIIRAQRDAQTRGVINMWTVYAYPKDYPNEFVARRFEVVDGEWTPTDQILRDTKLHVLRACLRCAGLTSLPRKELDDLVILETWI